jgi:hypothetical protein
LCIHQVLLKLSSNDSFKPVAIELSRPSKVIEDRGCLCNQQRVLASTVPRLWPSLILDHENLVQQHSASTRREGKRNVSSHVSATHHAPYTNGLVEGSWGSCTSSLCLNTTAMRQLRFAMYLVHTCMIAVLAYVR